MKLSQKAAVKTHRVLLFGPPKAGKTQLAGELSKEFNLIWVDLENGVSTLMKLPQEQKERIEVITLPDTRSYPIGIETCLKLVKGGPLEVCEEHGKVGCALCKKDGKPFISVELNKLGTDTVVVFDSLTQLTASAIANITKGQPDDYKMQTDDWGNLGKLMETFLSHIQNAPYHVVCISHETEVPMVDGSNKIVPTAGSSKFSRNTAKFFDEVVYLQVKNGRHVAGSSSTFTNSILTGSRSGAVMEKQAQASLIPIFKGEVQAANPAGEAAKDSPGAKALSSLDKLKQGVK